MFAVLYPPVSTVQVNKSTIKLSSKLDSLLNDLSCAKDLDFDASILANSGAEGLLVSIETSTTTTPALPPKELSCTAEPMQKKAKYQDTAPDDKQNEHCRTVSASVIRENNPVVDSLNYEVKDDYSRRRNICENYRNTSKFNG